MRDQRDFFQNWLANKRASVFSGFLVLMLIAAIGWFATRNHMKNTLRAFNCEQVSPEEVNVLIEQERAVPFYQVAKGEPTFPVRFRMNLSESALDGALLFLTSQKSNRLIFGGPYQSEFVVHAGKDLLEQGGMDNFRIVFIHPRLGQACSSEQEVGGRAWRTDVPVQIQVLPYKETDEKTQMPIAWKIG